MLIVSTFKTPAGGLEVVYDEHYIYRSSFTTATTNKSEGPLGILIEEQIAAYIKNPHHRFQLPLKPLGSAYQQQVWSSLLIIPVGRTMTYGELATRLHSSPRAIGQACKRNPLTLFLPCHRVVGKNNKGGYMGCKDALHYKLALLAHEASFTEFP